MEKVRITVNLDKDINDFIDKEKWNYKTNRSQFVNTILKVFKKNEIELKPKIEKEIRDEIKNEH